MSEVINVASGLLVVPVEPVVESGDLSALGLAHEDVLETAVGDFERKCQIGKLNGVKDSSNLDPTTLADVPSLS